MEKYKNNKLNRDINNDDIDDFTNEKFTTSLKGKIIDSINQFIGYIRYDEQQIKDLIKDTPLLTLEEFLNKTTEEINKEKPGICEEYNFFVKEFMDPNTSYDRMQSIIKEVFELTHKL